MVKILSTILISLLFWIISPTSSSAKLPGPPPSNGVKLPGSPTSEFTETSLIGQVISTILPIILTITGFITVIIIIISGIEFITSSGNPEAAGKARSRLTYAIVGFIVILLSFAALQIVDYLFLKSGVV